MLFKKRLNYEHFKIEIGNLFLEFNIYLILLMIDKNFNIC